ncbi:(S)-benzoin forming benzil reductase [Paenibacillus sp. UNC451MF]|uniref:(S)-benzoin forming benzil reductase n=1 Tax=Paenibacillus sp. UNC451MF TaxID=1449063 RepID=UPI00048C881F|nr:(S)-benzoin forming benzil reductase [Paenibacillus sp. UNC451MF]
MKYFIITGTSRGIGQAMAEQLIAPGHCVLCISRSENRSLISRQGNLRYFPFDLGKCSELDGLMDEVFTCIDSSQAESIYLINNAAVVAPLASIEQCSAEEITYHMQVNLIAPMILTSMFIQRTEHIQADKRIMNISSASSKHLFPGMSCYSSAKAGLDTFTQAVSLEQQHTEGGVRIASVWPGMIETALQAEARTTSRSRFASADIFTKFKEKGMLTTPEYTAEQLVQLLLEEDFGHGSVVEQLPPIHRA